MSFQIQKGSLVAAVLLASIALVPRKTGFAGPIVINEFMAINTRTIADEDGQYDDWIELYNSSTSAMNIAGYYLSDISSEPRKWQLPAGTTINGQSRLLIWADGTNIPNPARPLHASFRLNGNDGEIIALYATDGATTLDVIRFGQQAPDCSYGRYVDNWPVWGPFRMATPRDPNLGYTPPPNPLVGVLFVNEWLTSNTTGIRDPSGKREDWLELYNASEIPIDLGGLHLTDNLARPGKFLIPAANVIGPRGFALFWADDDEEEGPTHTNFRLSDLNEEIAIYDAAAQNPIDTVIFGRQTANVSQGRKPDGSPNILFFSEPTPRGTNDPPIVPTRVQVWHLYR